MSVAALTALGLAVRFVVAALLLLAGGAKLVAGASWRQHWLQSYALVPQSLIPAAGWVIALAEISAGMCLVLGVFGRLSAAIAAAVLTVVTAFAAIALSKQREVDCGCVGPYRHQALTWAVVARNCLLIGMTPVAALWGVHTLGIEGFPWHVQAEVFALTILVLGGIVSKWTPPARSPATREVVHDLTAK